MGQYWTAWVCEKEFKDRPPGKLVAVFDPTAYNDGFKLTEHSYQGSETIGAVHAYLLNKQDKHVAWIGDYGSYHEDYDIIKNRVTEAGYWKMKFAESLPSKASKCEHLTTSKGYLVNYTQKQFIDLAQYHDVPDGFCLYEPLPILTAISNGKGGGDYEGTSMKYVGAWAFDNIGVTEDAGTLDGYEQLKDKEGKIVRFIE
jgi:hypothetical protein